MDENTMALNVPDVLASALDEELVTLMHNQMHLFPLQYAALQQILMLQVQLLGDPLVDARAEVDELVANDGQNLNSPQVHAPDSSTGCETASCYVAPQDTAAPSPLSPPSAPPSAPPQPPPPPREVQALTPERERQLLSCFMLQDEVSPALCKLLAAELHCSHQDVRAVFTKLKTSVRNCVQRLQKRAANGQVSRPALGPHAHVGTHIHVGAHTGQRQQRMQHIQRLLDASNGGIGSAHYAGTFVSMMLSENLPSVRLAMARMLQHTNAPQVLLKLASVTELLEVMHRWLLQADGDRQITLMQTVLASLAKLPFTPHQLRGHALLKTVRRLHKHKHHAVAVLATRLGQQWAAADAVLMVQRAPVARKPVIPSRIQQAGAIASTPAMVPVKSWMPSASVPAASVPAMPRPAVPSKPSVGKTILSADDIIRNRERQKKLASMGVKRPAQGPPGGVDVQAQHVAQRAKWEATQQAVYRRSSEEEAQVFTRLANLVATCAWQTPWFVRTEQELMAGNESQEVPALDAHIAHVQELVFPFASAIPRTPTDADTPDQPNAAHPVAAMPWFPIDPREAAEQDAALEARGMVLHHQLAKKHVRPAALAGPAAGRGRGLGFPKRSRPVNIPGFR